MNEHPYPNVGWILNNSCGDGNYKSNIPRLSDEALLYCFYYEKRASGHRKLKAEVKKRNMNLKLIMDELPFNREGVYVMKLQIKFQEILQKFGLLEQFINSKIKSVYLKLKGTNGILEFRREGARIQISHSKTQINSSYLFTLQTYNAAWRPEKVEQQGRILEVRIFEDGKPALSCKGYLEFKELSNEYAERLEWDNWNQAEVLEKAVDGKDLIIERGTLLNSETLGEKKSRFQGIIDKIMERHGLLQKFYDPDCSMVYLKLHQEGYLDLTIERQGKYLYIGHYRIENGDVISDPIMRYELLSGFKVWDLTGIEQYFGDSWVYSERDGKKLTNTRLRSELQGFATMFANNINGQGWIEAEVKSMKYEDASGNEVDLNEDSKKPIGDRTQFEPQWAELTTADSGQYAFPF